MGEESPSIVRLLTFVICSYGVTLLAVLIGFLSQFVHWLLFDSFGRRERRAERKFVRPDEFNAIIIGAGFSGIGSAIKLRQLGTTNFRILERNGHIGGTWYANTYPGCACDVPSNLYSFSFEPNPRWSFFYSRQPEIRAYIEHCAEKYDVRRHIQFNTSVNELRWIEEKNLWQIDTRSNDGDERMFARFVIAGSGPLSNASYPKDIPGLDRFRGELFHTARWKNEVDFRKKRVAVIGTGASAIQVVPAVQAMGVEKLLVFQRTPPWTIPRADRKVTLFEKQLFTWFPWLQRAVRRALYWSREALVLSFGYRWPLRFVNETLVQHHLRTEVKDEALRKKVTPSWELGCKRVLVTSDWYPALQKANVELVTNRIREVRTNSIVTFDGDEYPVDIIILATGFETQKFSIPTFGIGGCALLDQWAQTMQAYRGMTVPNYPNLFILLGPNSRLGHSSVIIMLEAQLKYLVEALLYVDQHRLKSIAVKASAHEQFNRDIQSKLKRTVWSVGGCHSWYQDAKGNVTTIWPDFTWIYHRLMQRFDAENYLQQ